MAVRAGHQPPNHAPEHRLVATLPEQRIIEMMLEQIGHELRRCPPATAVDHLHPTGKIETPRLRLVAHKVHIVSPVIG